MQTVLSPRLLSTCRPTLQNPPITAFSGVARTSSCKVRSSQLASVAQADSAVPAPERVVDVSSLLSDIRSSDPGLVFEDNEDAPVWEHEDRFPTAPITAVDLAKPEVKGALDPSVTAASAYSSESGFQEISVQELQAALKAGKVGLLLDVRTREEFAEGHVKHPSTMNIVLDELSQAVRGGVLDEWRASSKPVAVICRSGRRSMQATVRLTKIFGFSDVRNVSGGMLAWDKEGLAV